jgi:ligand-binding sensor domain-containing protein
VLGENQLSNTSIYSVCETKNDLVYIGTDQGLFVYQHGSFVHILGAEEQHGNSLFNLKVNNEGDLFCGNLRGQIFKLVDNKLELFYALPKKAIGLDLRYEFDNKNHLLIASFRQCVSLDSSGVPSVLYSTENGISGFNKLPDGRVLFRTMTNDSLIFIDEGKVISEHFSDEDNNNPYGNSIHGLNGRLINFLPNGKIQKLNSAELDNRVKPVKNERYVQFSSEVIWALDHAKGLRKIRIGNQNILSVESRMYEDKFISAMYQGKYGTLFFGTFGEGLIVVPNQTTKRHINEESFSANGIAVDNNNNVFLSTRDGKVLHYNNTTEIIENIQGKTIEKIFHVEGFDFGYNELFPSIIYGGKSPDSKSYEIGSIKDVYQADEQNVFIATSIGIFKKGTNICRYPIC